MLDTQQPTEESTVTLETLIARRDDLNHRIEEMERENLQQLQQQAQRLGLALVRPDQVPKKRGRKPKQQEQF